MSSLPVNQRVFWLATDKLGSLWALCEALHVSCHEIVKWMSGARPAPDAAVLRAADLIIDDRPDLSDIGEN
jgi:hypothetical protein